jgi:hypothetical protein
MSNSKLQTLDKPAELVCAEIEQSQDASKYFEQYEKASKTAFENTNNEQF